MIVKTSSEKINRPVNITEKQEMPVNQKPGVAEFDLSENLRYSGIPLVGNLPWGSHFCQFYQTKNDLLDILIPFFQSGLENNEKCVWITSAFLDEREAVKAMKKAIPGFTGYQGKGRVEIIPYEKWYMDEGKFDMQRVLNQWIEKHEKTLKDGYEGLRISGNPYWIDNKKDWSDFTAYEAEVNKVIGSYKILALCTYSLDKCDAGDVIDVVSNHEFALIKRTGSWHLIESSAHKKAEQSLRESEEKFRAIATNTPDHILIQDAALRYVMVVNPQLGLTEEEMIGKTDFEILSKEDAVNLTRIKKKVLKSGQSVYLQMPVIAKDGSTQYFEGAYIPKHNRQGKTDGIIGYFKKITERKIAEDALLTSEKTLRGVLDATKESVWLFGNDGTIIMGNNTAIQRIGRPQEEVIGRKFSELLPPELTKSRTIQLEKVVKSGQPLEFEDERDGIFFQHSFYPVFDEKRKVSCVASFSRDITKSKKNLELLMQTQQRIRFHFDNSPLAIVEWDADFIVTQWSKQAERMFGWKAPETVGKPVEKLNMIFEDDIPVVDHTMELLMSGKRKTVTSSNRNYTKSGNVIVCTWHNSVMTDDNGKIVSVLSLVEDITEQKKAANALRESEERFKAIAEATPVGIGVTDERDGTYLYMNSAYDKNFGYEKGELIGHKAPEIYWDRSDRIKILEKLEKYGHVADYEVRLKRKDGTMFWSTSSISRLTFNGKPALLGAFVDITQTKQTEEALKKNSERQEILSDTASRLLVSENPKKIVNELCIRVMNFLGCHVFINYMVDENAGKLHMNAFSGISDKRAKSIEWLDYGVAVCGCVALDGRPIVAENIQEINDSRTSLVRSFGMQAYSCHPLMGKGKVIGTLSFGTKSRATFSNEDIALMKSVSDLLAFSMSRAKTEKELYDAKSYLENLINYANAPIIVWNSQSKIELFNSAFENLTGYASDEVLGKKLDFLFPEETLADSRKKISQSLSARLETVEIPILCKNREIKTFLWNSANIADFNSKKLISTIAQGHDITERKKVMSQLRESEEKLNLALENGNIGVWVWNILTNEIDWDERMERMFGFEPGTFGNNYDAFEACLVEEDIPHTRAAIKKALEEDVPYETVFRIRKNGQAANYINAKALVTKDGEGNPVKMIGVCFDITEMKKGAEQALFRLNEELLRSNKELEQFAYVASHDLQEPLRMISSFTQLLDQRYKDRLDNDAREFIRYAVEGASRMQAMINDLLSYSRIQRKGRDFTLVDMHEVLDQVKINLQMLVNEKKARITNNELPVIIADQGQMIQLMQNIVANSLKFSIKTPRIHVSVSEDKDFYTFSVKDNGIGIEKQYYERIFQIFQRLQRKEEYGGTGIGLAICKRIVEHHGGKIWLESDFGKGTVFYFTIYKHQNLSYAKY